VIENSEEAPRFLKALCLFWNGQECQDHHHRFLSDLLLTLVVLQRSIKKITIVFKLNKASGTFQIPFFLSLSLFLSLPYHQRTQNYTRVSASHLPFSHVAWKRRRHCHRPLPYLHAALACPPRCLRACPGSGSRGHARPPAASP